MPTDLLTPTGAASTHKKKKTKRERETNVGKCLAYYFFSWRRRRRETRLRFTAWLITSGLCSSRCGCFICCCKRKSVKTYDVGMLAFSLMVLIWYSKLFFIHKYDEFGACHLCWHAATGVGFRDSIHLCKLRHMELLALSKMCVYVCVLWLAPQQLSQPSSVLTGSWADSLALGDFSPTLTVCSGQLHIPGIPTCLVKIQPSFTSILYICKSEIVLVVFHNVSSLKV